MKKPENEFCIFNGKCPRVLLLGNGLNRAYGGKSWDSLLDCIKERDVPFRGREVPYALAAKSGYVDEKQSWVKDVEDFEGDICRQQIRKRGRNHLSEFY